MIRPGDVVLLDEARMAILLAAKHMTPEDHERVVILAYKLAAELAVAKANGRPL